MKRLGRAKACLREASDLVPPELGGAGTGICLELGFPESAGAGRGGGDGASRPDFEGALYFVVLNFILMTRWVCKRRFKKRVIGGF